MPSASSRLPDDDLAIHRMSAEPEDDDPDAAATKVGPMSQAFVDQMMFKAQLAESHVPPSRQPITAPPPSGERRTAARVAQAVAPRRPAPTTPVASADAGLPFEPTVLAVRAVSGPPRLSYDAPTHVPPPVPALLVPPAYVAPIYLAPTYGVPAWPTPSAPPRDWRLMIEVAVALSAILGAVIATVLWVFP